MLVSDRVGGIGEVSWFDGVVLNGFTKRKKILKWEMALRFV